MGHRDPTYVIFDGDEDGWAYRFMRGWKANERIEFDFRDAHDLDTMTSRAQDESYVKAKLRERMKQSSVVIVLVGEATKNLYKFVRWEIDLAIELGLPIIVVNVNESRRLDEKRCPAILRDTCAVHIPFKLAAIRYALDNWPADFRTFDFATKAKGWRYYPDETYNSIGL